MPYHARDSDRKKELEEKRAEVTERRREARRASDGREAGRKPIFYRFRVWLSGSTVLFGLRVSHRFFATGLFVFFAQLGMASVAHARHYSVVHMVWSFFRGLAAAYFEKWHSEIDLRQNGHSQF